MVIATRLNSFVFWLLFILFSSRCSLAYNVKATTRATSTDGISFTAAEDVTIVSNDEKDFEEFSTPKDTRFGKIGGRKMMEKRVFGKEFVIHMNHQNENNIVGAGVTKISGANHSVGNSSYGHKGKGEKINVAKKMRAKIGTATITTTTQPVKVEIGGLTAFSADYHMAKGHPPRNN